MNKTLTTIAVLTLTAVVVWAGQRLRVIDVDSSATPVKTTAVNVALTPAATTTNTFASQTATAAVLSTTSGTFATGGTLTVLTGAAPTLTLYSCIITDKNDQIITAITNVTITAAAPVTNASIAFATASAISNASITAVQAVTNVTGSSELVGFTPAQANGILTNVNLLYQMLQSY